MLGRLMVISSLFGLVGQLVAVVAGASGAVLWARLIVVVAALVTLCAGIYFLRTSRRLR